jgi:MFS family permease
LAPIALALPFLAAAGVAGLAASAAVLCLTPAPIVPSGDGLGLILRQELAAFVARLRDGGFLGLVLPLIAVKAVFATLQAVLPLFGERVLEVDLAHVSYLFVVTAIAYGLVQPFAGRLADRFATPRLIAVAFLAMAPLLLVMAQQTHYLAFLVPYALFSLAQCAAVLFALKRIGEALGESAQGRAFGLASALGDVGMIIAPAALLPLFSWRHEAVFWGLAAMLLVCLAGAWALGGRKPEQAPEGA